jgi:hypothetical protein
VFEKPSRSLFTLHLPSTNVDDCTVLCCTRGCGKRRDCVVESLCPLLFPASQLWDFDRIGKDKLIGTLRLPIAKASVQDGPDTPTWHTVHLDLLESGSGSVNTTAVIQRPELLVGLQVRLVVPWLRQW